MKVSLERRKAPFRAEKSSAGNRQDVSGSQVFMDWHVVLLVVLLIVCGSFIKDLCEEQRRHKACREECDKRLREVSDALHCIRALEAFILEFVRDDDVMRGLRPWAKELNDISREIVSIQQDPTVNYNPDEVLRILAAHAKHIDEAKRNFWDRVAIVDKVNKVLGEDRNFPIPKSHKEILLSATV